MWSLTKIRSGKHPVDVTFSCPQLKQVNKIILLGIRGYLPAFIAFFCSKKRGCEQSSVSRFFLSVCLEKKPTNAGNRVFLGSGSGAWSEQFHHVHVDVPNLWGTIKLTKDSFWSLQFNSCILTVSSVTILVPPQKTVKKPYPIRFDINSYIRL